MGGKYSGRVDDPGLKERSMCVCVVVGKKTFSTDKGKKKKSQ